MTWDGMEEAGLPVFGRLVLLAYRLKYTEEPTLLFSVAELVVMKDSYYDGEILWNLSPDAEIPTTLEPSEGHRWAYLPAPASEG